MDRVLIGRGDAGNTGVFITKPGYSAKAPQPSNRYVFSSDLETLDVQAKGSGVIPAHQSLLFTITPALPKIPFGICMWRPDREDGKVGIPGYSYGHAMLLDHAKAYDLILNLTSHSAGLSGVQFDIYRDKFKIINHFSSAIDYTYVLFDNYWEV